MLCVRESVCVCAPTLAVVQVVDGVVVGCGPRLVESGACVAEGGVWRVTVVYTRIPGMGVVRLLNLHCITHTDKHAAKPLISVSINKSCGKLTTSFNELCSAPHTHTHD